jgi:hypothetical protein
MSVIWGHVGSVVNRRDFPPSLAVSARSPVGELRIEYVIEVNTTGGIYGNEA